MFPPFVSKSFDCRFVQARPWFDPTHGSHQLPGLVLRVALMQPHVRFENGKAFCLANVSHCVFIPTVWIKNSGFLLVNQRWPTVKCGFRSLSV